MNGSSGGLAPVRRFLPKLIDLVCNGKINFHRPSAGSSPRSGTWPHRKRRGCSHTCLLPLTGRLLSGFLGRICVRPIRTEAERHVWEKRFVSLVLGVSLLAPACGGSTEGVSPLQTLPAARG